MTLLSTSLKKSFDGAGAGAAGTTFPKPVVATGPLLLLLLLKLPKPVEVGPLLEGEPKAKFPNPVDVGPMSLLSRNEEAGAKFPNP